MLQRYLNKFFKLIGLDNETHVDVNSFIIGYEYFIILEFNCKNELIINHLLKEIMINNIFFWWFRTYQEMEENFDLINNENVLQKLIIIG